MNKGALISIMGVAFVLVAGCGTPTLSGGQPSIGSGKTTGSGAVSSASTDGRDSGSAQPQTQSASSTTNQATTDPTQPVSDTAKQRHIYLSVLPGGKIGPDGKKHDAFSPSDFTIVEGVPVTVTIYNFDDMQHSLTATSLGLNIQAAPSKQDGNPGITTVTFTPTKAGDFQWRCIDPCDLENNQWAMFHSGYMVGTITVPGTATSAPQANQTTGSNSNTSGNNDYGGMMSGSSGMMTGQYGGGMSGLGGDAGMGSMMGGFATGRGSQSH